MLIIPAILESYRSLVDKTLKVTFATQELTPEQLVGIASLIQKFGYLAFKEDVFKTQEKDVLDNLEADYEDSGKTQSQRIRNVLYVNWQHDNKGYEDFNRYYDFHTEQFINHWKKKLP